MQNEKSMKIIKAIQNMTDCEVNILEIFLSGFQAGKQISDKKPARKSKNQSNYKSLN